MKFLYLAWFILLSACVSASSNQIPQQGPMTGSIERVAPSFLPQKQNCERASLKKEGPFNNSAVMGLNIPMSRKIDGNSILTFSEVDCR